MSSDFKMTAEEFKVFEREVKNVFDIVRVLDAKLLEQIVVSDDGKIDCIPCECYAFWKKGRRCENCISAKVINEKSQRTKLEILDSKIYQVFSKYAEIDGKPCAIEMLSAMEEDALVDSHGRDELLKILAQYKQELYTDVLTGAYNRRYYEECVKDHTMNAAVAMLDVDNFKDCNDQFSHDAGDMALKSVVESVKKSIRKTDMLIRMGGDEFLLILTGIDPAVYADKLESIRKSIEGITVLGYLDMKLTASIGGVMLDEEESVEDGMLRADEFLYEAKKTKNIVVV